MDTITSFVQEAMIIKGLKHPNIVELVGVVLQRAAPPYIVTPLTRNGDLGHFLKISRATSARQQVRSQPLQVVSQHGSIKLFQYGKH